MNFAATTILYPDFLDRSKAVVRPATPALASVSAEIACADFVRKMMRTLPQRRFLSPLDLSSVVDVVFSVDGVLVKLQSVSHLITSLRVLYVPSDHEPGGESNLGVQNSIDYLEPSG